MIEPKFEISEKILQNLIKFEVERSLIENQSLSTKSAEQIKFRIKAINMFHIAHIIGVDLTVKDAKKASEGKRIVTEDARGTILNNFRNILEYINSNAFEQEIDQNTLLHINKILLNDWKESWEVKFRTGDTPPDQTLDTWHHLVRNDIGTNEIQSSVLQILDWYRINKGLPDVLRIAIVVYQFIRIQPFAVLNKLSIIALTNLLFLKCGYRFNAYLSVSHLFDNNEVAFTKTIEYVINAEENQTIWLEKFLQSLVDAVSESKTIISGHLEEAQSSSKQPFLDLNKRQLKILRYLQTIPTVKREDYVQMMDVSTMTAFRDLNSLVKKQLLKVEGKGRSTKYLLSTR